MTDILIGTPGSVQRDLATKTNRVSGSAPVPASQLSDYAARVDVAELAYELWQERGRPNGSLKPIGWKRNKGSENAPTIKLRLSFCDELITPVDCGPIRQSPWRRSPTARAESVNRPPASRCGACTMFARDVGTTLRMRDNSSANAWSLARDFRLH